MLAALIAGLLAGASALAGSGTGARPAPAGFAGMVVDEPVWPNPGVDLAHQLDVMVASGVESLRVVFDWAQVQPFRRWNEVPAAERRRFHDIAGVPTDFSALDQLVGLAARRNLTVLPEILDAPAWDGVSRPGAVVAIPASPGPYAAFAKTLVRRYGPRGTFWAAHPALPKVPITMWQVWNEPDMTQFWPLAPFAPRYVALLRAAHDAIKSADPAARVVLAGLTNYSWLDLARIYRIGGARSLFDVVAVHPFTRTPQDVITILTYVRQTMDQAGDARKPLLADEVSWPSARGQRVRDYADFVTTPRGQARNIATLLPRLLSQRVRLGLLGFYYYNWAGYQHRGGFAFEFSGLFGFRPGAFVAKPAFSAFRRAALAIEGCRAKGRLATSCTP